MEMANKKTVEETGIPEDMTREQEYNLLEGLLKAASFTEKLTPVRIERDGQHMFTFHVHGLSEKDKMDAYKKATTYMANPAGKHLPQIEKETPNELYRSYIIFLATSEEDKQKIWGNKELKQQLGVLRSAETIDLLLLAGEKDAVVDLIAELSGFGAQLSTEEFAKN